jgi:hypothetical protein
MTDIFREVDDALQKEKLERVWQQHGSLIIGGVLAIILGTALSTAWTSWRQHSNEKATAEIIAALEDKNPQEKLTSLAGDLDGGHKTVALLAQAGLMAEKGDAEKAAGLYKQVYESRAPESLRDLARVFYVRTKAEKTPPAQTAQDLLAVIAPVMNNNKSPWTWQARLDSAVLTASALGKPAEALSLLAAFDKAEGISASLKDKAAALQQVYAAQGTKE